MYKAEVGTVRGTYLSMTPPLSCLREEVGLWPAWGNTTASASSYKYGCWVGVWRATRIQPTMALHRPSNQTLASMLLALLLVCEYRWTHARPPDLSSISIVYPHTRQDPRKRHEGL